MRPVAPQDVPSLLRLRLDTDANGKHDRKDGATAHVPLKSQKLKEYATSMPLSDDQESVIKQLEELDSSNTPAVRYRDGKEAKACVELVLSTPSAAQGWDLVYEAANLKNARKRAVGGDIKQIDERLKANRVMIVKALERYQDDNPSTDPEENKQFWQEKIRRKEQEKAKAFAETILRNVKSVDINAYITLVRDAIVQLDEALEDRELLDEETTKKIYARIKTLCEMHLQTETANALMDKLRLKEVKRRKDELYGFSSRLKLRLKSLLSRAAEKLGLGQANNTSSSAVGFEHYLKALEADLCRLDA